MSREYTVKRKLQEQSGSFFVTLPKIWVEAEGLEEGAIMSLVFNGIVKVLPPSASIKRKEVFEDTNLRKS